MTKRLIAVSDIHGCYRLLRILIEDRIKFDPVTDTVVMIGDCVDRGKNSKQVVEYVSSLKRQYPDDIILLLGNHEDLAYKALINTNKADYFGNPLQQWFMNGGGATIESYGGIERAKSELLPFIEGLALYHETSSHILVHAGIPRGKSLWTATKEDLLWYRDFSYDGTKTLVVGHTPHREVTKYPHIVAIDTGAFITGKLSGYDVLNDEIYEATDVSERSGLLWRR